MPTIPDPATTEWVPIWNPQSAGPAGPAGPPGLSASVLKYRYSVNLSPPPNSGHIQLDSLTFSAATVIDASMTTDDGIDAGLALLNVVAVGTRLILQDASDSTILHRFDVIGAVVNNGSYATIPIAWVSGSGTVGNNQQVLLAILVPPGPHASTHEVGGSDPILAPWITVPFNAGDFTASGSMTWTLASGNLIAFAYRLPNPNVMQVSLYIYNSTVGGTASGELYVKLPAGKTARGDYHATALSYYDSAGRQTGVFRALPGQPTLSLMTDVLGTAWKLGPVHLVGQLTFDIN